MRLILTFNPIDECDYNYIDKYAQQGFIYHLLKKDENYSRLHDQNGSKICLHY